MEIISNGKYNITYKNIQYNFESGNSYKIDEETAKHFIECGFCRYAELENDTKSKKTTKSGK